MRILNIGCGEETYGTDRIDYKKTGTTTKVCDMNKGLPYLCNIFDEVYARNVFEHTGNPMALLMEMKRVCKKGGKIRIITDNATFPLHHWNLCGIRHGDYKKNDRIDWGDIHFMIFTPEHLRNFCIRAELKDWEITLGHNEYSRWDGTIQKVLASIFGKRIGYPKVIMEARK